VIQAIGLRSVMVMSISLGIFRSPAPRRLGKLLQAVVDLSEIDGKDVQSLLEPARLQDLVALQRAVGVDCDRAQPVVRLSKKKRLKPVRTP